MSCPLRITQVTSYAREMLWEAESDWLSARIERACCARDLEIDERAEQPLPSVAWIRELYQGALADAVAMLPRVNQAPYAVWYAACAVNAACPRLTRDEAQHLVRNVCGVEVAS